MPPSPQTKNTDYIKPALDKKLDSANQNASFDPYGYYTTETVLADKTQRLEWIFVSTRPDHTIQSVELRITNISNDQWTTVQCTDYTITKDSLAIHYSEKKLGDIQINGIFRNITHANAQEFDGTAKMNDVVYSGHFIPFEGE